MTARRHVLLTSDVVRMQGTVRAELEQAGFQVSERYELGPRSSSAELVDALSPDVWGVIAGAEPYSRDVLDAAPSLALIVRAGVGTDSVDIAAATDRGIPVVVTPGANTEGVADYAVALMLALVRELPLHLELVKTGAWRPEHVVGGDLHGATVGLVGLGAIGRAVARRLRAFDCRVLAHEPYPDLEFCEAHGVEVVGKQDLLAASDIVSLHAPLTDGTRRFVDAEALAAMKPTALVVNTSRGGLVDEQALGEALAQGRIAGAALDVMEAEPVRPDHPLLASPRVLVTGHVAGLSAKSVRGMCDQAVAALRAFDGGRDPAACANPEALARKGISAVQ